MPDFTTTALLASIRRRGAVPSSSSSGTADADLLAIATEEQRSYLAPELRKIREDFYAFAHEISTVLGTAPYLVPSRAQAGGLQEVELVDSAGVVSNLTRIPRREKHGESTTNGRPERFFFEGGRLVLSPTPDAVYTLRIPFFLRPSDLVATSAVRTISAIDTATRVVTLSSAIPATFTTAATYDFVRSSSGFEPLGIDRAVSAASGTSMTFSAALPADLAVGHYVCLAGETPVPLAPVEFHDLLAARCAEVVRQGPLRDAEMLPNLSADREALEARLLGAATPRVEGESETAANTSTFFARGS